MATAHLAVATYSVLHYSSQLFPERNGEQQLTVSQHPLATD